MTDDEIEIEMNLRVPGPTPLPPRVRDALARPMMNHRDPDFEAILREVHAELRYFFATENPVLTFPASGTGGLEASIVNLLSPGDEVVAAVAGVFGERYAGIATAFDLTVHRVEYPWGSAVRAADVVAALHAHPRTRAVLLTQNETSTGVLHPIEAIAGAVRAAHSDVLLLVDGISGLATAPLWPDDWDLDVVVTGSQKAWMTPPGLTMLSVSPRAWDATATARLPRLYWDFAAARRTVDQSNPPYTPAVSLFYALQTALRMMRAEGREHIWARHSALAARTRAGISALGLELFADPDHFSPSVTSVCVPDGVDANQLRHEARERRRTVFGGGQGCLSDRIIRIGHLGWVNETDIDRALDALAASLAAQGWTGQPREVASSQ